MSTATASDDCYEVIYNADYGGFRFPDEFVHAVFKHYPPDSEIGKLLWKPIYERIIREGEMPDPSWKYSYTLIVGERPFYNGYKRLFTKNVSKNKYDFYEVPKFVTIYGYITKDYKDFYYLDHYENTWRESTAVIELGKAYGLFDARTKKSEGYADRLSNDSEEDDDDDTDDEEHSVGNDEDNNDDKNDTEDEDTDDDKTEYETESIIMLNDTNETEILTNACKGKTDLKIKQVPVGYDYHVDEYDGYEKIIIKFPYKKVICELLEARKTGSDDGLSLIAKKLVDGTLDASKI